MFRRKKQPESLSSGPILSTAPADFAAASAGLPPSTLNFVDTAEALKDKPLKIGCEVTGALLRQNGEINLKLLEMLAKQKLAGHEVYFLDQSPDYALETRICDKVLPALCEAMRLTPAQAEIIKGREFLAFYRRSEYQTACNATALDVMVQGGLFECGDAYQVVIADDSADFQQFLQIALRDPHLDLHDIAEKVYKLNEGTAGINPLAVIPLDELAPE